MSQRQQSFYPPQEWQLTETRYAVGQLDLSETLFALGNGYLGVRGGFEEGNAKQGSYESNAEHGGAYLNGIYTSEPITYGEKAYGYARHNQRMVTAPCGTLIELYVDGERFSLAEGEILDYERSLDFRSGILRRRVTWRSPGGKTLAVDIRRLVSLEEKHLCAIDYQVTPLNFTGKIQLISGMDSRLPADGEGGDQEENDDPRAGSAINSGDIELLQRECREGQLSLLQQIHSSGFRIASGAVHRLRNGSDSDVDGVRVNYALGESGVEVQYEIDAVAGLPVSLTKYLAYFSCESDSSADALQDLSVYLDSAAEKDFDHYVSLQRKNLDQFWSVADVEVRGDVSLQQGMRFNLFQLYQALGRDGKTNIAAKGLTGDGYDGHYFWDTEIYILPFFLYTKPELARKLLEYRHHILDAARQRARELAIPKGALFPWRTIGGEECSAYYPAGTAQYHINADIAYAVKRYYEATGDAEFMCLYGAEIVLESARVWIELGCYDKGKGFCVNTVTGPDEYTALVNNNFYTNLMAKAHLAYAEEVYRWLSEHDPVRCRELMEKMALGDDEPAGWQRAAEQMYLPYCDELGVHPQDDSFLEKKVWDFEGTPAEHYPLLLSYHPLVIYRHQVCKQADVVLGLLLRGEEFSREQKKRDFDYYEPITTHDSTLSACIHSIIASEVGYTQKAQDYFRQVARMDLDNHHNNTQYGVHTACMGGAWMCMVNGFAGLRVENQRLCFSPYLPSGMEGYKFRIQFGSSLVEVDVTQVGGTPVDGAKSFVRYTLVSGEALTISHRGEWFELSDAVDRTC